MPDPIQALRDLYKTFADKADMKSRNDARHWDGTYKFPERLPQHMVYMGEDLPPVSRAPMYRPQSEVIGGQEFANGVDQFLTAIPELRGRAPKIQHGPNEDAVQLLDQSGYSPGGYGFTNLLGTTNRRSREVSINPRLTPEIRQGTAAVPAENDFYPTLGHELGHVVGASHGDFEIKDMERLSDEAFRPAIQALRRLK